jgi:hypothetical protein
VPRQLAGVLLAQRSRVITRRFPHIGTLAEPEVPDRDTRRLAHDVDENRHLVEHVHVLLVAPLVLGSRVGKRVDAIRPQVLGQHCGLCEVVL